MKSSNLSSLLGAALALTASNEVYYHNERKPKRQVMANRDKNAIKTNKKNKLARKARKQNRK